MFDFDGVPVHGHSWGTHDLDWFDKACSACEVTVDVVDEDARTRIIEQGGLHFDKRKKKCGFVLARAVVSLGLQQNDRLEPGLGLPNIAHFSEAPLPLRVTFWRCHWDRKGRLIDRALHRNPVFSPQVGITPLNLHIDALHTVYLGVYSKYVASVIWAAVDCNLFSVTGGSDTVLELTTRRIFSDMSSFWALQPKRDQAKGKL
eukprot:5491707-Pyramimonas_sp.AAC.1